MSTTVMDALMNAQMNFETSRSLPGIFPMAMEQLGNAIEALENGKGIHEDIQQQAFGDLDGEQ